MLEEFKEEYRKTALYKRMINQEEVILAYVTGSRLTRITDERSDIDINCITIGRQIKVEDIEYLKWKGIKVHYTYHDIQEHITSNRALEMMSNIQLHNILENDTVLYCKEGYKEVLKRYKDYSWNLLENGIYKLYKHFEELINEIINSKKIEEKNCTKFLYHLCYGKEKLINKEVDKEFLCKLKRIRYVEIGEEKEQKCIEELRQLKEYIASHELDYEKNLRVIARYIAG